MSAIRRLLFRSIGIVPLLLLAALAPPVLFAANNPVPYIDIVSPVSVHPGATSVTLTVLGAGFVSTSVVEWNGISLTTTFLSAQKLAAAVPDSFVAAVGLGSITVVNPTSRISNVVYFPVASAEAGTTFLSTPSSTVTVGNGPTGVVTADFNGDGKLDLAVANMTDGTVTILLGNGDGTFTKKSTLTAGSGANWLAVGDFNEDGKLDLAVANSGSTGSGGVTILLGNGDGTFTTGASLTTGEGPFAIVTADFNKDGHLDLAVSNANSNTVTVLLGTGSGTFSLASTPAVGGMPQVLVVGDFNEDGKLDLAVSNESDNTVSVLLGNADGTFQTQSVFSSGGTTGFPIGLMAADFNGDGHLDLAAVNASDVGILLGSGTGTFTLRSDPSTGSNFLISGVTGDYNGDGKLDIVVADQSSGQAFLLLGNGDGTFGTIVTFTVGSGAYDVATADFNGDGALDLAITNSTSTNVSIFLQQLPVSLAPTSLAFGNQGVGSTSSPAKTVTLTNHSGSSLSISSITFTGADSGDFARPGGTCSTSVAVPSNSTCTMTVNFTPGAAGARTGTLTITDGAGNSPQTLGLTGTGVVSAPTISKTFGAATIPLNASTTLSFTITNPIANVTSLTGVAFSDSFPAGLLISTPNGLTGSCGGGTFIATAGTGSLSLAGATIASSGSCTFGVNVVGITAGAQANTTGAVSSNQSGAGATSNTATVTVLGSPTITKSFGAASVALNGSTTLTFTVSNTNAGTALTGVGFTDTFPSGMVVATPNGLSGSCGGGTITATAGSSSATLSGAALTASSSCNFTVNVIGTAAGALSNTTGAVASANGGTGGTASASLAVVAPPSIAKAFGAATLVLNGTTSLTFTVTNPAANSVAEAGVAFTDTLPAGLVVATPNGLSNSCGGTAMAVAGSTSISLSGGSIATPNTSCTEVVNVTGTSAGQYTNVTGSVSSTNGGTGNTASANLRVASPPVITKGFGASTIPMNGTTSLTFNISNANTGTALTGITFTDSFPSGLVVATPNSLSSTCGGTATAAAGAGSATLSSGTLAASGTCAVSLNVTGATAGVKNNSVQVTSTEGGTGNTSNASITVLTPPVIIKAFGAASIPLNGSTLLSFTIQNNNTTLSLTGLAFSDALPAGLLISTPNGLTGTCGGGTITATQGTSLISLSAATLAASSSCNFSVNVTGAAAGSQSNTTSAVTSANGGTGGTASANLAVVAPPSISKAFGASGIALNGTTSLSFTLTNPTANTVSLTGVAFTDTLPSGIVVATPNGLTGSCGGGTVTAIAGSGSVSLSGATLATSASCVFSMNVTGTAAGSYTNTTNAVSSTNGGTGSTATANLSVASPPTIAKSFGAATISLNGSTSLSFTITNPIANSISLTGVAFTDSLPSGLVVATPNGLSGSCGGGTITATAGSSSASLSGATLAASGSCTFSVNVMGTTAGVKNNSVSVTSTTAGAGNTSNASVTVVAVPTITKSFGAATVPLGGSTTLTFTVSNPNTGTSLTGVGFTDTFPSGLVVATPNGLTGTCGGGTITATQGTASVILAGAILGASSSCNFTVNVTGTTTGALSNTTGAVTSANGGAGGTASANLAVLAAPSISKSFGVSNIPPNGTTSLTFTITNPAANTAALTGVAFTDTLPANLFLATPNGLIGSCGGGTITAIAGSGSVSLAGATLATNGVCSFSVNVTGSTIGNFTNVTAAVSSANGGTGNTASAPLAVNSSAAITSLSSTTFSVGSAGSFTITSTGSPTPSFSITGSLPTGVTFTDNGNGTATLSGTPAALSGGTYPITITAHNGTGSDSVQNFTLTVDQSASITSANTTSFLVASAGSFTVTTSGTPAPSITKTGTLPNGVTLTDNGNGTATLAGLPAAGTGGSYPITITAHNGIGSDAAQSFTLIVNQAAAITSANNAAFAETTPGTFTVTVTGFPLPILSETGALPTGVTFNTGTGVLSGTPVAGTGGAYPITFTAHNGVGSDAAQSFTLTVDQAATITSISSASFTFGLAGSFSVTTTGKPTPALSETGTLPAGVTFTDNGNGIATLSGTPAPGSGGIYTFTITAHNGVGTDATQTFTITIAKATPVIAWPAPAAIAYGTALSATQLDATANVPGTFVYLPAPGTVLGAGLQTLSVTFTPSDTTDYSSLTANVSLAVNKGTPAITWAASGAITYGTALTATQLDATANDLGTFVYSPPSGTVLGAGLQTLSVTFTPTDTADYSSLTANVSLTVNKGTPAITWAAPAAVTYGTALSLTQLDATSNTAGIFVYTPAAGAILGAGPQTLSVAFTPTDATDYLLATAQTLLAVNPASTTTIVSVLPSQAGIGANVTFTSTVSSSAGTPTGNATFFDGATPLSTLALASGVATFTTSSLAAGAHSITCSYSGSANFSASTSSAVIETVSTPDFSVASASGSPTTQAGQLVNIPITLTPQGGFTGQVSFSVTGLPPNATAAFHPAVLTLGSGPSTDTLAISTSPQFIYLSRRKSSRSALLSAASLWFPLTGLVFGSVGLALRRNRKRCVWLLFFGISTAAAVLGGCASARNFQNQGTPAGAYSLVVTASSASISHTTTIVLYVH